MANRKIPTLKRTSHRLVKPPIIPAPPMVDIEARVVTRVRRWYTAAAALTFACLVGIMWGAYNPHSGFPYESTFPYMSDTTTALRGLLYDDTMRLQMNTFYQLPYLLGNALGIRGSYVPYQVVYALLWWARGMLVFVVLRRFLPKCPSLCYCAGALTLVHSSDGALQWVGQMNQFGYIFWMLLAMYTFIRAWDAEGWKAAALFTATAAFLEYMSLWSYESQILLILMFPVVLMLLRREWRKPWRLVIWYAIPVTYVLMTYLRYARSGGSSYQESVVRKSWSLVSVAGDWAFNIAASLTFWTWAKPDWKYPPGPAYFLSAVAALVFAAGWVAVIRLTDDPDRPNPFAEGIRSCWILLTVGFAALVFSFPVFLMLGSARMLWRTQILSGLGSGMVMAALLGLVSCLPLRKFGRMALVITAGAAIVYYGTLSAIQKGGFHRWVWEKHRTAILEVLQVAPDLEPNTVIVLTNVPKDADPFGHNMWFDVALRLVYPGIPVAGVYYYADGSPSPGNGLIAEGNSWHWDGTGFGYLFSNAPLARTVVVQYGSSGAGKLLETLPSFVCRTGCNAALYRPSSAIITGPVSPIAARRYNVPGQ